MRAAREAGASQAQGERALRDCGTGLQCETDLAVPLEFDQLAKIREPATLVFEVCGPHPPSIRNEAEAMVPKHDRGTRVRL